MNIEPRGEPSNAWPLVDGVPLHSAPSFSDWNYAATCVDHPGFNPNAARQPIRIGDLGFPVTDYLFNPSRLEACEAQISDYVRPLPVLGTMDEPFVDTQVAGRQYYSAPMSQRHTAVMVEDNGREVVPHSAAQASFIGLPVGEILREVARKYGCNPLSLLSKREIGGRLGAGTNYNEFVLSGGLDPSDKDYPWHLTAESLAARSNAFGVSTPRGLERIFDGSRICPIMSLPRIESGLGYDFEFEGQAPSAIRSRGVDRLDITFTVSVTSDGDGRPPPPVDLDQNEPASSNLDGVFAGIAPLAYGQPGKNHPLLLGGGGNVVAMVGAGAPSRVFQDYDGLDDFPCLQRGGRFNFATVGMLYAPPPFSLVDRSRLSHFPPFSASSPVGDRPTFLHWSSPSDWQATAGAPERDFGSNLALTHALSSGEQRPSCNSIRLTISVFSPLGMLPPNDIAGVADNFRTYFAFPDWRYGGRRHIGEDGRTLSTGVNAPIKERHFATISMQYLDRGGQPVSTYFRNHFTNLHAFDFRSNGNRVGAEALREARNSVRSTSSLEIENIFDLTMKPSEMAVVAGRFSDVRDPTRRLSVTIGDFQARFLPGWGRYHFTQQRGEGVEFPEPFEQTFVP